MTFRILHRSLAGLVVLVQLAVSGPRAQAPDETALYTPDYRLALPGYRYAFPDDHGSHPEYKLEWWYYTGQVNGREEGHAFGYELTFFRIGTDERSRNPSSWNPGEIHVAHFALTDIENETFRFWEQVHRSGPGIAFAKENALDVRNGSWSARLQDGTMHLRAYAQGVLLELALVSDKPPVIHGIDGVSQKAAGKGQASHYYSMTRMQTSGLISIDGQAVEVGGESWMDHEFGTNQLGPDQAGWDWFSLQLDTGEEVMLYQLRRNDGTIDPNSSGTLVAPDGSAVHLPADTFAVRSQRDWPSPRGAAVYRLDWEIEIPQADARLQVTPLVDDQELVTTRTTGIAYWEGAVRISGTWRGRLVTGSGYVELTGYSEQDRPDI